MEQLQAYRVLIQTAQLQGLESMTCGEHCVCFLYTTLKVLNFAGT